MRERLYFEVEGQAKKDVLEALKNELKINKKIPIVNDMGETIIYTSKYDTYTNYIDFYLSDVIPDYLTKEPGKIQEILLTSAQEIKKDKPLTYPKIKAIIA